MKDPSVNAVAPGDTSGATVGSIEIKNDYLGNGFNAFECDGSNDCFFNRCD